MLPAEDGDDGRTGGPALGVNGSVVAGVDRSRIVAVVHHLLGSRDAAEDIVSDAIAALLQQDHEIRDVGAWLRTVAYRLALNELRRRRREDAAVIRLRVPASESDWTIALHDQQHVAEAVARLPDRQRMAALLHWGDDLSLSDVARIMECAVPTVRVHLFRARRQLRDQIRDDTDR